MEQQLTPMGSGEGDIAKQSPLALEGFKAALARRFEHRPPATDNEFVGYLGYRMLANFTAADYNWPDFKQADSSESVSYPSIPTAIVSDIGTMYGS